MEFNCNWVLKLNWVRNYILFMKVIYSLLGTISQYYITDYSDNFINNINNNLTQHIFFLKIFYWLNLFILQFGSLILCNYKRSILLYNIYK
jgi:hypothetical protein